MRLVLACLVSFSVLLNLGTTAAAEPATAAPAQHVVLVSIDGLAASYLDDPRANLPTLRKLAAAGAVAKGMQTSFPSVTWPSHTSVITGVHPARHGVIGNSVWNLDKNRGVTYIGDPELTKDEAIRVSTIYDIAHEAGMQCGSVIWPCSNGAKSLDWVIPDSNKAELHTRFTTTGFADELAKAGVDISKLGEWGWAKERSHERDVVYTQVTKHLLTKHQPQLLLVHLITPDGVEHAYGPHTREAYAAVAESDDRIAEIWNALQQPPLKGKATLVIVSDHGFAPYEKLIRPNVVLKDLALIDADEAGKVTGRRAWCVGQGGSAFIYVLDEPRRDEIVKQLREKLAAMEGVKSVLSPTEFTKLGVADPQKNPEAPHLVLTTGPGYSFNDGLTEPVIGDAGGLKGTHGHDPRPDYMHATFIAVGAGIKPGTKLDLIQNVDVAPTIAHLLGLEMQNVDGRIVTEILTQK